MLWGSGLQKDSSPHPPSSRAPSAARWSVPEASAPPSRGRPRCFPARGPASPPASVLSARLEQLLHPTRLPCSWPVQTFLSDSPKCAHSALS